MRLSEHKGSANREAVRSIIHKQNAQVEEAYEHKGRDADVALEGRDIVFAPD